MNANIKAKDASIDQVKAVRERIANRQKDRKAEIEIDQVVKLVSKKGKPENPTNPQ